MGPDRYRGRCGNASTDANCFADSRVERYSVRCNHSDANTERHANTGPADTNTYSYRKRDADS